MKYKNLKFLILVIPLLITTTLILIKTDHNNPPSSKPPTVQPQISYQTSSNPKSNNQPSREVSTPKQSSNRELVSPTLKENPNAPQIPYYLMATTNDTYLGANWAFSKIQASRAWDLTTGSSTTTVAVIDTGFELNHEDLVDRWYQNPGETGQTQAGDYCWTGEATNKATNNCDDDQNGYVDDWRGYDFFYLDNNPQAGQVNPNGEGTQHGSLVAGVIGATANNAKGTAGIDQHTKILPLQVFSDDGSAYTDSLVSAIDYATNIKVNVINLSLGTNQYDATLLSAINRARNNGILVVAASGNCALNNQEFCNNLSAPGRMTYPALYQNVIAVGATDSSDQRANYSSYGPQLDVVAPGSYIGPLPVYNNGSLTSYATASGTSFAAPFVTGLASLLMAQNPNASLSDIEFLLTESADRLPLMGSEIFTTEYGNGRINAHKSSLLGLASTQSNLLGGSNLSPRQPANGYIWRATNGLIKNDEFVLIGCRIFEADICFATVDNGTTYRFNTVTQQKGDAIQYIFINGSTLPSGNLKFSVHNREYANQITSLTK